MAKITRPELERRFDNLQAAIAEHIENINYGGCGVVAGFAGRVLEALDVPVDVLTPYRPASDVRPQVEKPGSARNWSQNGLERSHLVVRFRMDGVSTTWDAVLGLGGGRQVGGWASGDAEFGDGLTVTECVAMSSRQAGWNPDFDRKQIPKLRALVDYHLLHGM